MLDTAPFPSKRNLRTWMFIFTIGMQVLLGHIVHVTDVGVRCARRHGCWWGGHPNSQGCWTGTRVSHLTCGASVADTVNIIGCCVRWLFIKAVRDWWICVYFMITPLLHLICAPDMLDDMLAMPFFIGIRFTISPCSFISVILCSPSLRTLMYSCTVHSYIPGICQLTNCDVRCVCQGG